MNDQELYKCTIGALFIKPGAGGMNIKTKKVNTFLMRVLFSFAVAFILSLARVDAQVGYIYVHQSTVDESSNYAAADSNFKFNVTGGTTIVPQMLLNDNPISVFPISTVGTPTGDIGATTLGTLFSATPSGLYYRPVNTSVWTLAGSTSTGGAVAADRVDGGASIVGDVAVYSNNAAATFSKPISGTSNVSANTGLLIYTVLTNKTVLAATVSNGIQDVAFDRVNGRVLYIDGSGKIFYQTIANALLGVTFTQVNNYTGANRLDIDSNGNIFYIDGSGNPYIITNYANSSVNRNPYTKLANIQTNEAYDVGCADDGSYFLAAVTSGTFGVYKFTPSSNTYVNEPQSGVTFNLTGGPAGQMWSTYYSNNIWTRVKSGTTANWVDDERVRATTKGNSEMIAVTPGTYTITQDPTAPSGWNLQTISIYDPNSSSGSASTVSTSQAKIVVTAGEVVHVIYQSYFTVTTALGITCSTNSAALNETFGSGSSGVLGSIATGDMKGATSYHFFGTTTGTAPTDGYYAITTSSNDVHYGSSQNFHNTLDHTNPGTGYYLFVNASFQRDVFYQRQLTNIVPGNAYTISYYIANITGGIPPSIDAQITDPATGTVLKDAVSGTITSTGAWVQKTFTYLAGPTQTAVNLRLINLADGGNGNDIGIDDITFKLAVSPNITAKVANTCDGTYNSTVTITSPKNAATGTQYYEYAYTTSLAATPTNWQADSVFKNVPQRATYYVYSRYKGSTTCNSNGTLTNVNTIYKWTGATSTDITLGSNWSGGAAPAFDGTASIEIPVVGSGAKYPVLTTDESIFSLQIDGAPANINLGIYTLNVGCDIYNSTTGGLTTGTYPAGGILTGDLTKSTLNWNGSSPTQRYVGNATAGTAKLGNMTVTNTYTGGAGVVTMSAGPIDIYNVLTLAEGNLTIPSATSVPNTQLTLKSTATQTAALAEIKSPGSGITTPVLTSSTVNVERYLTGNANNYRGYRLLSSPVYVNTVNGVNVLGLKYINTPSYTAAGAVINYGALLVGPGGTNNGFDAINYNPTIYLYDETRPVNNSNYTIGKNTGVYSLGPIGGPFPVSSYQINTQVNVTTITPGVTIPVGNSYLFYFIGDNHSTNAYRVPENTTITAVGSLNHGDVPFVLWTTKAASLSYTTGTGAKVDGLNQVGNPYASSISLDQLYADNWTASNNISGNFYELVEPGNSYLIYQAATATSPGKSSDTRIGSTIVSGQGFIAGATGPNQKLTFKEDQKVPTQLTATSTPTLLLSLKLPETLTGLHLQLTKDADTTQNIQTGVYFSNQWSDAFNSSEDAADMGGVSPTIYLSSLTSDNVKVGINELGSYLKNKRVKLYVNARSTGQYHINMADAKNIDTLYNIYLVDKLLKDSVNLRSKSYDFTITTTDTTTFGTNRFELAVELKQLAPYQLLSFTGAKSAAGIQLQWKTANEGSFTGFTVQKQSGTTFVGIDSLQSTGAGAYSYTDIKPASGINTYRLMQNGILGNITYSDLVTINYNYLSSDGTLSIYPNPTRGNVNIYVSLPDNTYKINIYNSFGGVMKQQTVSGTYWAEDVTSYNAGTYIIEMTDNKGKFVGKTKFVKIK